ncbi:hypothetical protein SEA_ALTADENA_73 [Arthrobacter phage Altadena]|uniref:Uncharacterized protein n=1 Tax=Arthrobacter phage Altadena TaxID=3059064 RepID=A0AA96HU30_9CAUD|nr:hypothetical protein SEA_ALTADENA_73 [Arthrobacter phage Altadena]
MTKSKTPAHKIKQYAIIEGRYAGVVAGPLAIQTVAGPYRVVEEGILDPRTARARAAELERTANPARDREAGAHFFTTSRVEDYKPRPERYSTYEIEATYSSRRADPVVVELRDVRRRPSAVKDFKDYVRRVTAPDRPAHWHYLVSARLIRRDFYKGKPAGLEEILHSRDLPA